LELRALPTCRGLPTSSGSAQQRKNLTFDNRKRPSRPDTIPGKLFLLRFADLEEMIRTCSLVFLFGECPSSKIFPATGQDVTGRRSFFEANEIDGVGQLHIVQVRSVKRDGNCFGRRSKFHIGLLSGRMSVTLLCSLDIGAEAKPMLFVAPEPKITKT